MALAGQDHSLDAAVDAKRHHDPLIHRRREREGDRDGYGASDVPDWRSIDWRRARRHAIVAGRRVSYVDLGEGSPIVLVLVHGTGGCWQNWLENIAPLSLEHRVIAVDLPGFGGSEMPLARISFEEYADAVLDLSEQLELHAPTLVGHSMGGMISLEAARRRPGDAGAVVMVGGSSTPSCCASCGPTQRRPPTITPALPEVPTLRRRTWRASRRRRLAGGDRYV